MPAVDRFALRLCADRSARRRGGGPARGRRHLV